VKRLLLDLNIVLDVVLDRAEAAQRGALVGRPRAGKGRGYLPVWSHYHFLLGSPRPRASAFARRATDGILRTFAVASVAKVLRRALSLAGPTSRTPSAHPRRNLAVATPS